MMDRASSVGILAQRLSVVATLVLVGGSVACASAAKSDETEASASQRSRCRNGPSVLRVTNSGNEPVDLFLWHSLASGGYVSEFVGSVAQKTAGSFALDRAGWVQTREQTDPPGRRNQLSSLPPTLQVEYFCTDADRAG